MLHLFHTWTLLQCLVDIISIAGLSQMTPELTDANDPELYSQNLLPRGPTFYGASYFGYLRS